MDLARAENISLAVITPLGPGHEDLVQQSSYSLTEAKRNPHSVFRHVEQIIIDDRDGRLGPGAARNLGIQTAMGKDIQWLFFLDADDLVVPHAFEVLAPYLSQYDAIWGQIYTFAGNEQSAFRLPGQLSFTSDIRDILFLDPRLTLRIGHFVKRSVALEHPFDANGNRSEAFSNFLRVWSRHRCIKIPHPLCAKRRDRSARSPQSISDADREAAAATAIKEFKVSKLPKRGSRLPAKPRPQSMDIAVFGPMRSGTTLIADILTVKDHCLILLEPALLIKPYQHSGAEQFEFEKLMRQLQAFGFHNSSLTHWDKTKHPSFIQFFSANIFPLLSRLQRWGAKMVDFDDWEGFFAAFQPHKLILAVRDVRDMALSAIDLTIRLNRKFGTGLDELWIQSKLSTSCRQILGMAQLSHLLVRYEDLCAEPDLPLRIIRYAGLDRQGPLKSTVKGILPHRLYELEKHGIDISDKSVFRYKSEPEGPGLAHAIRTWLQCPQFCEVFGYERPPVKPQDQEDRAEGTMPPTTSPIDNHSWGPLSIPALNLREARQRAAAMLPRGATVLDLNAATMALETMLPRGSKYVPYDLVPRDERTIAWQPDRPLELPARAAATFICALGLLEYLNDLRAFLEILRQTQLPAILSYHPVELTRPIDRKQLGFKSHLTTDELLAELNKHQLKVVEKTRAGHAHVILRTMPCMNGNRLAFSNSSEPVSEAAIWNGSSSLASL